MKLRIYANCIKVGKGNPEAAPPPKRGEVYGLSKASRRRLLDTVNSIRNFDRALFVTLTYPDHFPRHAVVWKTHIANFRKRLKRQFPLSGGIWRLELKERKSGANVGQIAPHFHLLIVGATGSLSRIRRWVACAWYEVVKSGDSKHAYAGTNVERCNNRTHAAWYVAKYIAKVDAAKHFDHVTGERIWTGRMWGKFGELDESAYMEVDISRTRFHLLRNLLARWVRENGGGAYADTLEGAKYGFTLYGYGPEGAKWKEIQAMLDLDNHERVSNEREPIGL